MYLGGYLWQKAHYALETNTNEGCRLPLASSGALCISIWRACSQEKLGVHVGELRTKQIAHGNNSSFFNCSIQYGLLWITNFWGLFASFKEHGHYQAVCHINLNFPHGSRKSKMLNPGLLMSCATRQKKKKKKGKERKEERNPFPQKTHLMRQLGGLR